MEAESRGAEKLTKQMGRRLQEKALSTATRKERATE
jgi:hypothetical protein